jgi:hypothetical protein
MVSLPASNAEQKEDETMSIQIVNEAIANGTTILWPGRGLCAGRRVLRVEEDVMGVYAHLATGSAEFMASDEWRGVIAQAQGVRYDWDDSVIGREMAPARS